MADTVSIMSFTTGRGFTRLAILSFLISTIQGVLGEQPSTHYTPSTGDIISFTYVACVAVIVSLVCCYFCPMCCFYKWRMRQQGDLIYSSSESVPGYGSTNPSTYSGGSKQIDTDGYQQTTSAEKRDLNSV